MPDGSIRKGTSWDTSPMEIAKDLSKSLAERVVIAKVDGDVWDLERPLEKSCSLELLDFEHPEGALSSIAEIYKQLNVNPREARLLAFIRPCTWRSG